MSGELHLLLERQFHRAYTADVSSNTWLPEHLHLSPHATQHKQSVFSSPPSRLVDIQVIAQTQRE